MFRRPISLVLASAVLLSLMVVGVFAQQGGPPPPDATPGSVGFQGRMLGAINPAAAPGYQLVMAESVFAPGAYVTQHAHPTAIIVCVQSGALGFAIQVGTATITRGGSEGTPETSEPLAVNTEVILEPSDCVAFDEFTAHTTHTGWNASDDPTVLWEARLVKEGEPFTTFLNAEGTPVPVP